MPALNRLHCTSCGNVVALTQAEVDAYLQTETWPTCCGEVMSLDARPILASSSCRLSDFVTSVRQLERG